jgi:signal transduction histidine kinase
MQMLSFMFYIRFLANALFLKKTDGKLAWYFYKSSSLLVPAYCLLVLLIHDESHTVVYLQIFIRTYLLILGLLSVFIVWKKRESTYHKYLFAAAVSMIFFGILSSVSMIFQFRFFDFGPFHWLLISFFVDVIFFSSALGYLIKIEYQQKEKSLSELFRKEAELQQMNLEKMKAVYETREEERMRIARDIHDDMGSTLSSIGIYSKVAASYLDSNKEKANEYLEKINENTRMLMENTTDLIWSLQTNYGESESIFKRIHSTAMHLLSSANITSVFSIPNQEQLPHLNIPAQKNCWLIVKEALNNVCKYSEASTCTITVKATPDKLSLSIADNGRGFKDMQKGNGLHNMRQRTEELGGDFTIQSKIGEGTTVVACFPFDKIIKIV